MSATATTLDHEVGETLPPQTAHAISVSLPTWSANVGYEEGQEWVLSKMKTGYPRFFIHKAIQHFADAIVEKYGKAGESALLFPSTAVAARCVVFLSQQPPQLARHKARIIELVSIDQPTYSSDMKFVLPKISALLFPSEHFTIAKTFWQHSGDGTSSRRAAYCHQLFKEGLLVDKAEAENATMFCKGPRRYRSRPARANSGSPIQPILDTPTKGAEEVPDPGQFVEERFGRNLDLSLAVKAKLAIRRRIAGSLTANVDLKDALEMEKDTTTLRQAPGFSEDDVYLFPTGMSSIFNTHQAMLASRGELKSICYGFPYIDTLKILQKFGPGCLFYGHGSKEDLDDLETRLARGERFLAFFCEFPGNPLLKSPDLLRVRQLADRYDFGVIVDETIGNFLNVHVLPYADVVVSSLTKVFSGDSNVMGGSAILNPQSRYYRRLKQIWSQSYEDNFWAEDAIFLERNSRDFVSRIERINANAEAICEVLREHPQVKQVNYPKYGETRQYYDHCRKPNGGYGGLLSATFFSRADAVAFFDNLNTAKGPSLGTNFTLSSPYVILAHYAELDWAASFGIEADLIRFSVGLEKTNDLVSAFRQALAAIPSSP